MTLYIRKKRDTGQTMMSDGGCQDNIETHTYIENVTQFPLGHSVPHSSQKKNLNLFWSPQHYLSKLKAIIPRAI